MNIQWYPGHMAKAKREILANLKLVDVVIELTDARIPASSRNPDLQKLHSKPTVLALTKTDMADARRSERWMEFWRVQKQTVIPLNILKGVGVPELLAEVMALAPDKRRQPRALVVGIPNVGKSSLINRIAKRSSAKVGAKPGVTRGKQWIKADGLHLLDTPGLLWPRFDDQEIGRRLAIISSVRDEIFDWEELASWLLDFLVIHYPNSIIERYNLPEQPGSLLEEVGKRRGCLQAGGIVDTEKAARVVIQDFRTGKLGRITMELPPDIDEDGHNA